MPHVSSDQFHDAIKRLEPRFLSSNDYDPRDGLDNYAPSLIGLVNSSQAPLVSKIVQTTLELFRDKFGQDPDFPQFTLDEVFDRGRFAAKEKRLIQFVISAARLANSGGGSSTPGSPDSIRYTWHTPSWIETLLKISTLDDYLAYLRAGTKRLPSPTSPVILGLAQRNLIENSILKNLQAPPVPAPESNTVGEMMTRQLFISHSAKDKQLATLLVDLIDRSFAVPDDGIRCTSVDGYALAPGDSSNDVLKNDIRGCSMLIALLTRDSLLSAWVTMELGAAWILDKTTCAILAPDVSFRDVHGPISGIHAIKLDNAAGIANMITVIEKHTKWSRRNLAKLTSALQQFVEQANGIFGAAPEK
jgi:hypothetical protein